MLEWCLGNLVGEPDRRGNLYPTKQRPEQKIYAAPQRRCCAHDGGELGDEGRQWARGHSGVLCIPFLADWAAAGAPPRAKMPVRIGYNETRRLNADQNSGKAEEVCGEA